MYKHFDPDIFRKIDNYCMIALQGTRITFIYFGLLFLCDKDKFSETLWFCSVLSVKVSEHSGFRQLNNI